MEVIYSDKNFIVVNKPPGIPVHGGLHVRGRTLADELVEKFPDIKDVGENPLRPGIVHRLDKDTSGVMVVARNNSTLKKLQRQFEERLVEKKYWAIVCGKLEDKEGMITLPIGRVAGTPLRGVERGKNKVRGTREAVTEYKVLKQGERYSFLELTPKTGRPHQLRVHLKAIGHPVACDKIYGGEKVCCPKGAGRQLLHAKSLAFSFTEGRKLYFEADPPEDMKLAEC